MSAPSLHELLNSFWFRTGRKLRNFAHNFD